MRLEKVPFTPFFEVCKESFEVNGRKVRFSYVTCPHGVDIGALEVTADDGPQFDYQLPNDADKMTLHVWKFKDLGSGICHIEPSMLVRGIHNGQDCHFGPGDFHFAWIVD